MIRWKVVRRTAPGRYVSWVVPTRTGCQLQYRVGKETQAPFGGCLVFGSLRAARRVTLGTILECEVRKRVKLPPFRASCMVSGEQLQAVWQGRGASFGWPRGTQAFRFVKPIRVVQRG